MQSYAEKFNLVRSWVVTLPEFLSFFLRCLYANVLIFPWAYSTQQVLLMQKQGFLPWQKSWTLRCLKDNQENPSTQTTVPNGKHFSGSTISPYIFPKTSPHGSLQPMYGFLGDSLKECHKARLSQAFKGTTKKTAALGYLCVPTATSQFTSSQRVVGSTKQQPWFGESAANTAQSNLKWC